MAVRNSAWHFSEAKIDTDCDQAACVNAKNPVVRVDAFCSLRSTP